MMPLRLLTKMMPSKESLLVVYCIPIKKWVFYLQVLLFFLDVFDCAEPRTIQPWEAQIWQRRSANAGSYGATLELEVAGRGSSKEISFAGAACPWLAHMPVPQSMQTWGMSSPTLVLRAACPQSQTLGLAQTVSSREKKALVAAIPLRRWTKNS